jgi:hypothetical protein
MELLSVLDELEAVWDKLASVPVERLSAVQALAVAERLERHRRRLPTVEHALILQLQAQATPKEMGAKSWPVAISGRLGISAADARRRLAEAAALGPRRALSGQPLQPELPATAAAQARGEIGTEHVSVDPRVPRPVAC